MRAIQVHTREPRRFAPGERQRETELLRVEVDRGGEVADEHRRVLLIAVNERSGWRRHGSIPVSEQKRHEPLGAAHVTPVWIADDRHERTLLDVDAISVDERNSAQ